MHTKWYLWNAHKALKDKFFACKKGNLFFAKGMKNEWRNIKEMKFFGVWKIMHKIEILNYGFHKFRLPVSWRGLFEDWDQVLLSCVKFSLKFKVLPGNWDTLPSTSSTINHNYLIKFAVNFPPPSGII
jgi:hypothetical protein